MFSVILVTYGITSFCIRRREASKFYVVIARIIAIVATAMLALWPMIYDSISVEHFPDEAQCRSSVCNDFLHYFVVFTLGDIRSISCNFRSCHKGPKYVHSRQKKPKLSAKA